MIKTLRALALISLLSVGSIAHALPILTPTGLNPGDAYQLAFVTSTKIDALSNVIGVYNAHVQAAADAAFSGTVLDGISWTAIASTGAVDARDNAPVAGPVYNLNDGIIAFGLSDMWDGGLMNSGIFVNELGLTGNREVWTGSKSDGRGHAVFHLGDVPSGLVVNGFAGGLPGLWIGSGIEGITDLLQIYALSAVIVVPTPNGTAPAPATLALFGLGLVGLGFSRRKREAHS